MQSMHEYTQETDELAEAVVEYTRRRIADPQPLDHPVPPDELGRAAGATITSGGIGGQEALRIWAEVLAPATITTDHPSFLSFVPGAPSKASVLFDLAVSASEVYGGSWLEGGGAVWAENQVLRWLADLAGMPAGAGGCFVSGGTAGNLSALVAARHAATAARGGERPRRWQVACADTVHSSVASAARVMDVDLLTVLHDERGRLTGSALSSALDRTEPTGPSPWSRAPARRTRAWWTTSRVSPPCAGTGAVAARRRGVRRRGAPRAERP